MENPQEQPTITTQASKIWSEIPLTSRFIMLAYIINFLLSLIIPIYPSLIVNFPFYTLLRFNLWRLLTASICNFNFIMVILDLLFFVPFAKKKELAFGTVKYIIYIAVTSACVQLVYALIMLLLSFIDEEFIKMPTYGLLSLFFAEIVADCAEQPEATQRVFISSAVIKAKYYPWILLFLFFVFSRQIFPFVAAMLVGYFVLRRWSKFCLDISADRIRAMESNCLFRKLLAFTGFIKVSDVQGVRNEIAPVVQVKTEPARAFSGKGVKVGSAGEEAKGVSRLVQTRPEDADSSAQEMLISVPDDTSTTRSMLSAEGESANTDKPNSTN